MDDIIDGVRRSVRARMVQTEQPNILRRLGPADYLSLGALFWGWVSTLLFVLDEPNWAVIAMLGAYVFDKLDGYVARRYDQSSGLGLQVDSYIDIFTYLVPGALLFHTFSPNVLASAVVGFFILGFGGLRLIRHQSEGFGDDDGVSYYHGITVVHVNVLVVVAYFGAQFGGRLLATWNPVLWGYITGVAVVLVSPVMVSDYKSYKTDIGHTLVAIGGAIAVGLCLYLEFVGGGA